MFQSDSTSGLYSKHKVVERVKVVQMLNEGLFNSGHVFDTVGLCGDIICLHRVVLYSGTIAAKTIFSFS